MLRILFALLVVVPTLAAQDQELQCKCRIVQGDEYLCKCVAVKGSQPSTVTLPTPPSSASSSVSTAAAAPKSEAKPQVQSKDTTTAERTASGAPIYVGPRGGRYHYSATGKKVYERRKN